MKTSVPTTIRIEDYKAPVFEVKSAYLEFDLHSTKTKVTAEVEYSLKGGQSIEALVLDGEGLELDSVELNGNLLSESDYEVSETALKILKPTENFKLKIVNYINPEENKALEGVYKSGSMFCTQCEAEGFRRITYFMDRPDVMTTYTLRPATQGGCTPPAHSAAPYCLLYSFY